MRLYDVRGRLVYKNLARYAIDWDGKSKSNLQFQTKQFLKPFWKGLIVYEECPVYGTQLRVDILNATLRIAIEVDGPQHDKFHYFHNNRPSNFLLGIKNDMKKMEWLEKNNFKLVQINFNEVELLSKEFFQDKFQITL